ncbi:MAG: nucleotidyltransferase domain-containing protein [Planctomycetes bacterium]|nr:nucleotidyltransferase domain-containing protein [Planctomycetota bacterium]
MIQARAPSIDWSLAAGIWQDYPFVVAAYHFGSSARGLARPDSDVDLALLLRARDKDWPMDRKLVEALAELQWRLQRTLKANALDVVVLNDQGLPFQHTVLRSGRLVYEGDLQARVLFESYVISWYCDFLPTLRLVERYQLKGLRKRAGQA